MPWPAISDDFMGENWTLSDGAVRLHMEGICWSAAKLYDCLIPKVELMRFARNGERDLAELLSIGWWADEGDCWRIVHHSEYQRTREQVLARTETNRRNGTKGGRPKKTQSVSKSLSESQSEQKPTGKEGRKEGLEAERAETNADVCSNCGLTSSLSLVDGRCRRDSCFQSRRSVRSAA